MSKELPPICFPFLAPKCFDVASEVDDDHVSVDAFEAMIEYIYNKKIVWKDYGLSFLASLYYLADKYDISELRQEIIASIPEHKVSEENVRGGCWRC